MPSGIECALRVVRKCEGVSTEFGEVFEEEEKRDQKQKSLPKKIVPGSEGLSGAARKPPLGSAAQTQSPRSQPDPWDGNTPHCKPSPPAAHDGRNLPSACPSRSWCHSNFSSARAHAADTSPHRSNPRPQLATPKPTLAPTAASPPPDTHTPATFFPERWNRGAFYSFSRISTILHLSLLRKFNSAVIQVNRLPTNWHGTWIILGETRLP